MRFNLNEFLMAISFVLDFVEIDIFGVVNFYLPITFDHPHICQI
jgi:hypothetical protein